MKIFVIAMEKEAAPLVAAGEFKKRELFGKTLYEGELFGKKTAVLICGVGKANAAAGAQIAISLGADEVVNLGVAGGLHAGLKVGKIYSISAAVQYDFDISQLDGKPVGTLDGWDSNFIPLRTPEIFPAMRLGTGDRFNDSPADHELLTKALGADIRDMEGGAIAQICAECGVKCSSFKVISDVYGSGSTTEQYLKNLEICAKTLEKELKTIAEA